LRRFLGWLALAAGLLALAFVVLRTPDIPAAELNSRYASPASRFVEIAPGFTVHLRDEGNPAGPALFLIHGSNASLHSWEPWVARLRDRFRLVSLDLQGHGLTGPHPAACYTRGCMAETVEAVRRHLGIESLAIAGNSMGGGVALAYALAHPERTAALILVASSGAPVRNDGGPPLGFRIAQTAVLRDLAAEITPRAMIERTLDRSVSVKEVASAEAATRYWELLRHPGNRDATLDRFATPREPLTPQALKSLAAIPTLILWGEEDALLPVSGALWFAAHIPGAAKIVYPGIGHLPQEEAPDRSAADVAAFLAAKAKPAA
jgi:pimeloyl-ACP methyl ester carboxylesterase